MVKMTRNKHELIDWFNCHQCCNSGSMPRLLGINDPRLSNNIKSDTMEVAKYWILPCTELYELKLPVQSQCLLLVGRGKLL